MARPPLIGITTCVKQVVGEELTFFATPTTYIEAVRDGAGGLPMQIPSIGAESDPDRLLDALDGLLVTGSRSNVDPPRYGAPADPDNLGDAARDATTLPLIRRAVARGVPMLAICRGIQEVNVAFGGTLHPKVAAVRGLADHHPADHWSLERKFGPAHAVTPTPGGQLADLAGAGEITVNSVHTQGLAVLAPGLTVEAVAPDGLVEAVRVADAPGFALAVQWHPEWNWRTDAVSAALFRAFGAACREAML